MVVIGIDLAGSSKRDTGFCVLDGKSTTVEILHNDDEILNKIVKIKTKIKIIAIDAPLNLPFGRKNIDQRNDIHFRKCDLELRNLGIRFFPITLGPMRMLTKRGIELKNEIGKISDRIKIIEVYPGATYDIVKTERKNKLKIMNWLKQFAYIENREYTQDELDGICCAITAKFYMNKQTVALGDSREGQIIIPKSI